jgi:hypothetical protein
MRLDAHVELTEEDRSAFRVLVGEPGKNRAEVYLLLLIMQLEPMLPF